MLQLNKEKLIGKGWHRECYEHPNDRDLCIKVVVNGNNAETNREQAYYRYLTQHLTDWRAVPRFHGNVETNLGQGAVFDLVYDSDGQVSRTLGYYLESPERFLKNKTALNSALAQLKQYQLQHNVLTMSLKPNNLLIQRNDDGAFSAHIIDNLGNADWIPLANYFSWFGSAKIERKWSRFHKLLGQTYPHLGNDLQAF